MSEGIGEFLLKTMNKQNSLNTMEDGLCFGTVISSEPLIIKIGDLPYNKNDLNINYQLLEYDETIQATTLTGQCSVGNAHVHAINKIHHYSKLIKGKTVVCYGIEPDEAKLKSKCSYQKYVVLFCL